MRVRTFILSIVVFAGLSQRAEADLLGYILQDGVYSTFQLPSGGAQVAAINNTGQILLFTTLAGPAIYKNGVYTYLNLPEFPHEQLVVNAFNDQNLFVGEIGEGEGLPNPGLAAQSSPCLCVWSIFTITPPGSLETVADGVNDAGEIVGSYDNYFGGPLHGFLEDGVFTTIDFPGALSTFLSAISDNGEIVGEYVSPSAPSLFRVFIYNQGVFTQLPDLQSASGVNDAGDIVGLSTTNQAVWYHDGALTNIDPPGSTFADVRGINDSGQIVGDYAPAPIPEPGTALYLSCPLLGALAAARLRVARKSVRPQ